MSCNHHSGIGQPAAVYIAVGIVYTAGGAYQNNSRVGYSVPQERKDYAKSNAEYFTKKTPTYAAPAPYTQNSTPSIETLPLDSYQPPLPPANLERITQTSLPLRRDPLVEKLLNEDAGSLNAEPRRIAYDHQRGLTELDQHYKKQRDLLNKIALEHYGLRNTHQQSQALGPARN